MLGLGGLLGSAVPARLFSRLSGRCSVRALERLPCIHQLLLVIEKLVKGLAHLGALLARQLGTHQLDREYQHVERGGDSSTLG